jgi:hypothetical protein
MQEFTLSPPSGKEPTNPPTPQQDHAVLIWLALLADLPHVVQLLLFDALLAWEAHVGPHRFPTPPEGGPDSDLMQVIEGIWWRRSEEAVDAAPAQKAALNELCGWLALALAELAAPVSPQPRLMSPEG